MVAGYSSGTIAIFNIKKGKLMKKTKSVFKNEKIKIVKFLKTDESKKKSFIVFASNEEGKMKKIIFHRTNNFGIKKIKKQTSIIYNSQNGGLLQIEPIYIEPEDKQNKKIFFLACSTFNKIFIQNLDNLCNEYEIDKTQNHNFKTLPLISFDKSDIQETNIKSRLVISWENTIFIVNCVKTNENKDLIWKNSKYIIFDQEIIYSSIISSQIILGIDNSRNIFLLNFEDLFEGDIKNVNPKHKIDLKNQIFQSNEKEVQDLIELYIKKKIEFSERNLISSDFFRSTVYFFINTEVFCLNLISWDKHIENFLDQNDYVQAMSIMTQIYKNKIKYFGNIPANWINRKLALSTSIKEIAVGYFLDSVKKIQDILSDYCYVKEIALTIEFLIETEHFDFLFNNIMKDLELRGYMKQFIHSLEPFIIRKKIRFF